MSVPTLTQHHRAQQLLLRRATVAQVSHLWPALDWARLDATYPTFAVQVAKLVQTNRRTSAGLASQYVRASRKAAGIRGEVRVVLAEPVPVEQFNTSLRVTSLVAAKSSAARGTLADVAMREALTQASGSMARLVLDAGRDTVLNTVKADSAAFGFQRVLGGAGCEFCQMLADRGAVYKNDTAGFESHDHCGCTSEPVYDN